MRNADHHIAEANKVTLSKPNGSGQSIDVHSRQSDHSVVVDRVPSYKVDQQHSKHVGKSSQHAVHFDNDGHARHHGYPVRKVSRLGMYHMTL